MSKLLFGSSLILITSFLLVSFRQNNISNNYDIDTFDNSLEQDPWLYENDFFDKDALEKLDQIVKSSKLRVIVEDEGIQEAGEAVPLNHPNCNHPYMTVKKSFCALPNRLDVAMHFLQTGGFNGRMESYEKMAARIITFRHKLLNTALNETQLKLIYGEKFLRKAREVCSKNEIKHFDKKTLVTNLFQFDVIIMLPGQELPMHLDLPYFWNADRRNIPHWLLILMKKSNLFNDRFIPQVQGVAWLSKHQYKKSQEESRKTGGNFFFYPYKNESNKYILSKSEFNSAILVDGTHVVHGVERYMPERESPPIEKNGAYYVSYNKNNNSWDLYDSIDDRVLSSYLDNDVRTSLVWRVHCFNSEEEKLSYHDSSKNSPSMSMEDVFSVLKNTMSSKNKSPIQIEDKNGMLDFFVKIIDEYAKYPKKTDGSILPAVNYCLLPLIMPKFLNDLIINPLLNLIC